MNKKIFSAGALFATVLFLGSVSVPAEAAQTRSQKFQAAVDDFETQVNDHRKNIDDIQEKSDVNEKYSDTGVLLDELRTAAHTLREDSLSKIYLANKKEKKILRITIHQFIAQLIVFQRDADAALLVEDNGNGKAINNALDNVLSDISGFLKSDDTLYHSRVKSLLKGKVNQSLNFIELAVSDAQATYDIYVEFADTTATQNILYYVSKANNAYLTAASYYDSGTAVNAINDLQLLNQAGREILRCRARLSTARSLIEDLEGSY